MGKLKEFDLIVMKQGKNTLVDALSPNKKYTLVINLSDKRALFSIPDLTQAVYEMTQESIERMLSDVQEVNDSMRFNKFIFYTDWCFSEMQDDGLIDDILNILDGSHCVFMVDGM